MNLKSLVAGLACLVGASAATVAWGGEIPESTRDYVQTDLVACWDGVENAGRGIHDPLATAWTDIMQGLSVNLPSWVTVEDAAMYSAAYEKLEGATAVALASIPGADDATQYTVEQVIQRTDWSTHQDVDFNNLQYAFRTTRGNIGYRTNKDNGFYYQIPNSTSQNTLYDWTPSSTKATDIHTVAGVWNKSKSNNKIYLDGNAYNSADAKATTTKTNFQTSWGFFYSHWVGIRICAIRVYKRALTATELQQNRAVDVERFVNGNYARPGDLVITSNFENSGEVTPGYGVTHGHSVGETVECTAVESVTNEAKTVDWTCVGCIVRTNDAVYVQTSFAEPGLRTFSFAFPECSCGAVVEWQWRMRQQITVTTDGNGTAAVGGDGMFAVGDVVTLSATPNEGYAFGCWTGEGVDSTRMFDNPCRFAKGESQTAPMATFRKIVYVSKDGSDENGGTSWDDALATVPAALAKETSPFVLVGEGTYDISAAINLTAAATVCGSGNRGTVFRLKEALDMSSDSTLAAFKLGNAGVRLTNLALTTGGNQNGRGVYMTGGQVDNCTITNCLTVSNKGDGGGAYLTGGVIRNCLIKGNRARTSGTSVYKEGGGVYMTAGLVENCTISGNFACGSDTLGCGRGGGVRMTGGTLRNCLVSGNRSRGDGTTPGYGSGIYATSASTIENCTVVKNAFNSDKAICAGVYAGGTTVVRNSIVLRNTNSAGEANVYKASGATFDNVCTTDEAGTDGVISGDPAFVDEAKGDWHIGYGACVDVAEPTAWALLATDLDGGERVINDKIDLGCYEFVPSGLSCGLEVATDGALDEAQVTLTGSVMGAQPETVTFDWTVTDSLGRKTERSGLGLAELVLPMPTGVYTVKLVASKGTDSDEKTGAFTVFAKDLYVSLTGSGELPFGSFDAAATNLCDVIALAGDGTTIHLADGTYRIKSSIVLSAATVLTHDGERENCIVTGNTGSFLFTLDNAGARIENIDVCGQYPRLSVNGKTGAKGSSSYSTLNGVRINNGLVTNCIVESCYGAVDGAGVTLSGGKLVDSVIRGNYAYSSGNGGQNGGGVCVNGGLVDRCTITNNVSGNGNASKGGGLMMTGGTVRNSVIVGNWSAEAGGVKMNPFTSATLESCTVVGNVASGTGKAGGLDANSKSKVVNTIIWNNTNTTDKVLREKTGEATFDTCWTSDPVFKPHGAPWRLHKTSPCRNAGKPFSWMETARDFYGNPRILLDAPDIGAVEMPHDLGLIIFVE